MNSGTLKIHWQNRTDALAPCALVAFDEASISLAKKLLTLEDETLTSLEGVGAKRMILLIGDGNNLPWTDGAIYLGRDRQIPSKLIPTTIKPAIPLDLFEKVLNEKFKGLSPFAVLPEKIIPYGGAKRLSRSVLKNWLIENQ